MQNLYHPMLCELEEKETNRWKIDAERWKTNKILFDNREKHGISRSYKGTIGNVCERSSKGFHYIVIAVFLRKMYMDDFTTVENIMECKVLEKMLEFRWHGRGGQGAWTASELLARAAIHEGKYVQSFPEFGPERMGAPVTAFTRVSTEPIKMHCAVYNPDIVAVLDPTLIKAIPVAEGISEHGAIIINSRDNPAEIRKILKTDRGKVWAVPATEIAIKILGIPITNTAMLGAVTRVTEIVKLESLETVIKERFRPGVAEKNFAVIKEAYEGVKSE